MNYRVIKENNLFLLTDEQGDITSEHSYGLGLYKNDTRYLSKLNVKINHQKPILLHSDGSENYMSTILSTNPHQEEEGHLILWRESVEIERKRFIYDDVLYETIKTKNYYPKPVSFELSIEVDVDFNDMFIVRGFQTGKVGNRTGQKVEDQSLVFQYEGADGINRATNIHWDAEAKSVNETGEVTFQVGLQHEEERSITLMIVPLENGETRDDILPVEEALQRLRVSYKEWAAGLTKVETDYEPLQRLVDRGLSDLRVLLNDTGYGKFPVAGLPWFGVPFGRDSLIAALQMIAFQPQVAKGTLFTMASEQGTKVDPWRDEQPGKIMHEIRYGELANTNQIPFTPYYGTIDATPLFLVLLTEYVKWTGDFGTFRKLSDNVKSALKWIDQYGDRDGDLFLEYHQESSKGIANQGWKDSGDSVVHRNGDYADTPIALVEVQGYVYQAKRGLAAIYEALEDHDTASRLKAEAKNLQERFEQEFWMEDLEFYAIALDRKKEKVGTITSNPGHVLYSEMMTGNRAEKVSQTLTGDSMFSGYGIRTMGKGEAGYNPMSYHDGSVWPHDNSMTLLGLSKLGLTAEAKKVMSGLIDASHHFEYDRLPELFCGYESTIGKAVKYPVACSPQAWAAGTPLVFVQSLLGLFPNSLQKEIHLHPILLNGMNTLTVQNIAIGEGVLSLSVVRNGDKVETTIMENTTGYNIVKEKQTV
ncbi:amylo-alpha-1,6-glucosidase [Rossellomorea vietnamensis]|uniref:Amylo-alpha-1,6-glucosidase n=1 Tax=Rossellomorea vietnamensis TaxID=218284 RepID=A0ACD4CC91_9BACI|nr:amylo-alpha-1,6-glucosidase [Rossellomorea vietnamensis]UXH46133.1 amylo-alpha-1,6-glucosidase [Rossellomorea vietnamensis]WQI97551.1 amylo-alpha-1,6-glucosidase [Rossellomorea vietnamensis]